MNNRETAYALTRITYGVIFLFYGIGKFRGGISNFVGGMNQQFSGSKPRNGAPSKHLQRRL